MNKLSTETYKGTSDWFPEEYKIKKYIFQQWRKVCTQFGYEEYLTPLLEYAEIYKAKSGEDLGGKELMTVIDRAGRELAIRPEMTPSVTRMVSKIYESSPKPIRYFSIANFMRGEKPQRGRGREFWQLNFDMFGSESINADIEILQMSIEIMLSFNPPTGSFTVFVNNRKLINAILAKYAKVSNEQRKEVVRVLDKFDKVPEKETRKRFGEIGLEEDQVEALFDFITSQSAEELIRKIPKLKDEEGYQDMVQIMETLDELGYSEWVKFQPNIIRGLDYYDGMVFEVFDNAPDNNRSMFGGGRYNGLSELFSNSVIPAVGVAPGDMPITLFLESWGLTDDILKQMSPRKVFIPLLDEKLQTAVLKLAQKLRLDGEDVTVGISSTNMSKALKYADKKSFNEVVILGEQEIEKGEYKIKNMESGTETYKKL